MKVKFSRCSSNNLANVPQVDGQLIYTKDTSEVYLDVGNNRNKLSDVIEVVSKSSVVTPILSKLYYETSTDKLFKPKTENNEIIWVDITGATVNYVQTEIQNAKDYADSVASTAENNAKDYADSVASTAENNANTYTDNALRNYAPMRDFPSSVNTTGTTQQFLNSIASLNLPTGSIMLGLVRLSDMPVSNLIQAEVKVEVYRNNVIYCRMSSADTPPYNWECNSFRYAGWQPIESSADVLRDANAYTDSKIGEINDILDEINGVEV